MVILIIIITCNVKVQLLLEKDWTVNYILNKASVLDLLYFHVGKTIFNHYATYMDPKKNRKQNA